MNSILNSISSGDLQVQEVPRELPVKKDSIIELLKNSEIEFNTCPKLNNTLNGINTGFGENNDLHFDTPCKKPNLITPLYKENYLSEFQTEEEKAAARHALGIYNKGDIVAMSLLTAEDVLPTQKDWNEFAVKQLRKGDRFFTPITSIKAVYDSDGISLDIKLDTLNSRLIQQQKELVSITQISNLKEITSLGDIKLFLKGFNSGDNLYNKLDSMDQKMLRFETTGQIS